MAFELLTLLTLTLAPQAPQAIVVQSRGSFTLVDGEVVLMHPDEVSPEAQADASEEDAGKKEESERQKKLAALSFDRRPSAILEAWSAAAAQSKGKQGKGKKSDKQPSEAEALEAELQEFGRQVTLGDWSAVRDYLASLEEAEAEAGYKQLLASLQKGPKDKPNVPNQGKPYLEKNRFSPADVLGLAQAAPAALEKDALEKLGQLLSEALAAGHQLEAFLAMVEPVLVELPEPVDAEPEPDDAEPVGAEPIDAEPGTIEAEEDSSESADDATGGTQAEALEVEPSETPQEPQAPASRLDRRNLAYILLHAGQKLFLADYLPTGEEAIEANDREGLNLLAQCYLARFDDEGRALWLEEAWAVTQAVLAKGKVGDDEKSEALTRAVDIAPKLRDELGQAWLDESFTRRPQRGMEILAAIGSKTSKALSEQPMDADWRFKLLELQTTTANSLLAAAPELASEWSAELSLLAENWLREAIFTYTHDQSTARGPMMEVDPWGNQYFFSYSGNRVNNSIPKAISTGDMLEVQQSDAWLERVDATLRPRLHMMYAQLLLKVSEEAAAFPHIERVARDFPRQAQDLADEFFRVWAKNNNPNQERGRTVYFGFGYTQRASGIPLTRSKQERNLRDLGQWVARLRQLPIQVDEELVSAAFMAAHSSAEVYRLETIEEIFGPLEGLDPKTLASLLQTMRANLVTVWRDPALQKDKQTQRRQDDIRAEVLRGYELARSTLARALASHPESWELSLAKACLDHDQNNYRKSFEESSEFSARRDAAFDEFAAAAGRYARASAELEKDDESIDVYQHWFYAALGASDLNQIDPEMPLAARQIPLIKQALTELPKERAERHVEQLASTLFARMGSASAAVKFRYVREGLGIVGDHEMARQAREVFDYYSDLVTEIRLVTSIDGPDRVGHDEPFGLRVDLRHTKEIERESGGFGKYLQNQNAQNFSFNFGRPTEDYRDKFEDAAREALSEQFDVVSVTFNHPEARSIASEEYGWRTTPYAYVLLRARGPEVDRLPGLRLDLDFLDTTGYAVLPVESSPLPLDASEAAPRPWSELSLTQTLDERQAKDGKLSLELRASAHGLVPAYETLVDLAPEGFEVTGVEDAGVSVIEFADSGRSVRSERLWTVSMRGAEGLAELPSHFEFARAKVEAESSDQFRYADADLLAVEPVVALEQVWGKTSKAWLLWIPAGLLALCGGLWLVRRAKRRAPPADTGAVRVPDPATPFAVLGMLREIRERNGLAPEGLDEIQRDIASLEHHFFAEPDDAAQTPDLVRIAEGWASRARLRR